MARSKPPHPPTDTLIPEGPTEKVRVPRLPEPSRASFIGDAASWFVEPELTEAPGLHLPADRYSVLGLLGSGAMGEVYRVLDAHFNRTVAMKVLRQELLDKAVVVERFLAEAQITGQLQHPGIVAVYEVGTLADGRHYYTMQEVAGRELSDLIADHHGKDQAWTLRRLVEVFHKATVAVAYAHSRNVLHRDLKPRNVLAGPWGEALVVDWGLSQVILGDTAEHPVIARVSQRRGVSGTPAFMAPEQARGEREQGPPTDVYALGSVLFSILTGQRPWGEMHPREILRRVSTGSSLELPDDLAAPERLAEICQRCLCLDPLERYPHAGALANALQGWLEGSARQERARAILKQAREKASELDRIRARGAAMRRDAERILGATKQRTPEMKKLAWAREDAAHQLERGANVLEGKVEQLANAALAEAPELPETRAFLADRHRSLHAAAEAAGDEAGARRHQILLGAMDVDGRYADYVKGHGSLTLLTDPEGAKVTIFRLIERNRMLVPEPFLEPMTTPIRDLQLKMGSYTIEIEVPGRPVVRYPVHIRRQEHWDGQPPGGHHPHVIYVPESRELASHELYVPAGWYWSGHTAGNGRGRRVWVDAFVMDRFPVTNTQYIAFLNFLVERGRHEEAEQFRPASFAGIAEFRRERQGFRFELEPDVPGAAPYGQLPVVGVDHASARAFARWRREQLGSDHKLPRDLQWEKAARGVDGRQYPWGNHFDETWACMAESHRGATPAPSPVDSFPVDVSPYGVRGMGGNVRSWCRNTYLANGPAVEDGRQVRPSAHHRPVPGYRAVNGGSWSSVAEACRSTHRQGHLAEERLSDVGIHLIRGFRPRSRDESVYSPTAYRD